MEGDSPRRKVRPNPMRSAGVGPKRIRLESPMGSSKSGSRQSKMRSIEETQTFVAPAKTSNIVRKDRKGHAIIKGGKKHIVSFADTVRNSKTKLVTTYDVESYKDYNVIEIKTKSPCSCLLL